MNEPAYLEPLRAFYRKAQGNPTPQDKRQSEEYVAASEDQFSDICALMLKAQKALGEGCRFSGSKQSAGNVSAWITCDGFRFRVRYRFATRPQSVTQTSREAYQSLDFSTCRGRVLEVIYAVSLKGLDVTRAEIADVLDMDRSGVSGRVNELFEMAKAQPFRIDGKYYRLSNTSPRLSNLPGATVKNEAFRLVECPAYNNSPAAQAAQTKLFT